MGAFSDNYFDLLSEANAIKKGNKGDELWSEITNVIQEQLIPFVKHYTGPFKALVRTNKPGQNNVYYLSHWCLFAINEELRLGVKLTISKEGLSICYDFPHDKYKIKRVVYSTYQAVSGAGLAGYQDLENGLKGEAPKKFPHPIAGNCLPHIDSFLPNGYTKEEMKMVNETRKILGDDNIKITATTVRVPVFNSHSESINVEFYNDFDLDELKATLAAAPGIIIKDDPENDVYPLALDAAGTNETYVGRIRRDESVDSGVNLWVVADNIRKGAATNAVQIAEKLIQIWEEDN